MKKIEYASASDKFCKPKAKVVIMAMPSAPRKTCSGQRTCNTPLNAPRHARYRHTSGSDDSARSAVTCIAGYVADSNFIAVSINENIATAISIA